MTHLDDVRRVGDQELLFLWSDGKRQLLEYPALRLHCPCAGCVDEMTGRRLITPERIRPGIHATDWKPVGNYALQFRWSDGHQTGIYSFDYLRSLA